MKSLIAFLKKEIMEQIRSGKIMILGILFVMFGIMNPAIAKLTPWIMEIFAESLEGSGIIVTEVTVTALDSWMQFYKNIPMALIVFILLQSSIFTKEYGSDTLILSLTKGLERFKVVLSKTAVLIVLWTACYWLCFGITYVYNAYFWDNSIAENIGFSAFCWWLFGVWVISLAVLFSTVANANTGVLLGTGSVVLASYLVGLLPKINKYMPTFLTDGNSLIYGIAEPKTYTAAIMITAVSGLICFAVSIPVFNKKQL
ncbi:MAG: ABC transporter permease [Ruminococcaceae bacterium]|nr:ABC transporter permease [Oscillospiraceae bacterium]